MNFRPVGAIIKEKTLMSFLTYTKPYHTLGGKIKRTDIKTHETSDFAAKNMQLE